MIPIFLVRYSSPKINVKLTQATATWLRECLKHPCGLILKNCLHRYNNPSLPHTFFQGKILGGAEKAAPKIIYQPQRVNRISAINSMKVCFFQKNTGQTQKHQLLLVNLPPLTYSSQKKNALLSSLYSLLTMGFP